MSHNVCVLVFIQYLNKLFYLVYIYWSDLFYLFNYAFIYAVFYDFVSGIQWCFHWFYFSDNCFLMDNLMQMCVMRQNNKWSLQDNTRQLLGVV